MKAINILLLTTAFAASSLSQAATVTVAVAANFTKPIQVISAEFERTTQNKVTLSIGSTGKLYAQIKNGAPYDVFLAADQKRPAMLVKEGFAQKPVATYAMGQLVLWTKASGLSVSDKTLDGKLKNLAIANPKAAPYGEAAISVMGHLNRYDALKDQLVQGQNIGQTYQYVETGNSDYGFVALSQVFYKGAFTHGSGWVIPQSLYAPIKQDVVLLKKGADTPIAQQFIDYLHSDYAKSVIQDYGYRL
jgi:molybdate transport system substrate-binding protein